MSQPLTRRKLIWPLASNARNSMQAVSAQGSRHCVLNAPLELLVQTLDGICGPQRFPLFGRIVQESEEPPLRPPPDSRRERDHFSRHLRTNGLCLATTWVTVVA
jgi:hypothetical protein